MIPKTLGKTQIIIPMPDGGQVVYSESSEYTLFLCLVEEKDEKGKLKVVTCQARDELEAFIAIRPTTGRILLLRPVLEILETVKRGSNGPT